MPWALDVLNYGHGSEGAFFPNYRRGRLRRRAWGLRALVVAAQHCPATLNRTQAMLSAPLTTRFDLRAEPSPGLLPRLLQPFAKRDVTPDFFQARQGIEEMEITIACQDLEPGMAALIAGNLGQVIGVSRVLVTPSDQARQYSLG